MTVRSATSPGGLRAVVRGERRPHRAHARLVDHAGLIEIERVDRADVHEPADADIERGAGCVAYAVDIDGAHGTIGIAGDRDLGREMEHHLRAVERAPERVGLEHVAAHERDVEPRQRRAFAHVDRAHAVMGVEERAHEVGAYVAVGAGDRGDHPLRIRS